jgi:HEAT repeat protein
MRNTVYTKQDARSAARSVRHYHVILTGAFCSLLFPLHGEEPPAPPAFPPPIEIQFSPPPQPLGPGGPGEVYPPAETLPGEDPYWQETVERAVEQFKSNNPEVRRSAVMLLGKYPVGPAREVVERALEDPDAGVRQAALVSVLEEPAQLHPAFANKLFRLLADPEVSIRRIASNALSMVIHSFPFALHPGAGQMHRQLPEEANRILREAFRDQDVSVRRNMVANYPFLRIDLPQDIVIGLLRDPDIQVAVPALQWGLPLLSPQALAREVSSLIEHENPAFRLELTRALQSRRSPEAFQALEELQNDPHPPVAIEAMLAIFYQRQSVELYQRILQRFREAGRPAEMGQRIILGAQMLGDQGKPFLREWMEESNPALRQQAVQVYLSRFGHEEEAELLLSLTDDPLQGVRQQALRALMQSSHRLTAEQVRRTISSRHLDVRRSAPALAASLPAKEAEDLLLDLLLDDARDVRVAALQQIGIRQIPGWEEIMGISLRVDDPIINRAAMEWLIRHPTPATLEALRGYVEENPRSPLRLQIESHLKRNQAAAPL